MKRIAKVWVALLLAFVLTLVGLLVFAKAVLQSESSGRMYTSPSQLPFNEFAVVLGCAEFSDGYPNSYFVNRIAAAAEVFHAGKVRRIIASGAKGSDGDEAALMKQALMDLNVPADAIVEDDNGFDTFNSIVRLADFFELQEVTVVAQPSQIRRAIFIARAHGIDAVGFEARSVSWADAWETHVREQLAQVKALVDVWVFRRDPR
ncbi:YdcF family protein [Mycolicibacterium sp. S2-37]|uniref:SanA/YdcF family protein n=1 Tax=Mycolicibacterium sp. S2-37 TaxID=2810297 RepID=UPI001A9442E1|nr:ElyC/SanA/YdcF family protein [Mycolicibacterium sp. S2-37]MBO0680503.1 YdcF family protein [Mycolicibacterium sp. S2-37]